MEERPGLFVGRSMRPIVRDTETLESYAAAHDIVLGVVAETPYVLFLLDLVEAPGGPGGRRIWPYQRVVSRAQLEGGVNVVVVATLEEAKLGPIGSVVLVEQERHATGAIEIELPRGFGEHGQDGPASALRELHEETGFDGDRVEFLGSTYTDSGLTDSLASFYHVSVVRRATSKPESTEAINRVRLAAPDSIWREVAAGKIRDAFTVVGLSLLERHKG